MRISDYSVTKLFVLPLLFCLTASPLAQAASGDSGKAGMKGHHQHHKHKMWMQTLTDDQKTKIMGLKWSFKSKKFVLKAKKKQLKVELAVLLANDKPDSAAINKKLDEILAVKKSIMNEKISFVSAVRGLLTPQQKTMFDLHILKKMYKGKAKHH